MPRPTISAAGANKKATSGSGTPAAANNSGPATNEEAIEFLKTRGWETEAVRDGHYRIDDEYVDEVMLAKRLN
jgi:hypothetical protein